MEQQQMKYRELRQLLNSLSDDDKRLDDDVTIYEAESEEFYSKVEIMDTKEVDDVLPKNHLYIAFE
jgi:hypothetical protein